MSEPSGFGPRFRCPTLVTQGNPFNKSKISTVACVPLTSNLKWTTAPGNILLKKRLTGLTKDSVVNVSQIIALDRSVLTERRGRVPCFITHADFPWPGHLIIEVEEANAKILSGIFGH